MCVCVEVVGTRGAATHRGGGGGIGKGAARGHAVITHHSPCGQWPD